MFFFIIISKVNKILFIPIDNMVFNLINFIQRFLQGIQMYELFHGSSLYSDSIVYSHFTSL